MTHNSPNPTRVVELCCNVDDATGEDLGHACTTLLDAGALDVWTTPIQMKKQRPAVMLSVLCEPDHQPRLTTLLFRLTGTLGVRHRPWDRTVLHREHLDLTTTLGTVRIKLGRETPGGPVLTAKPEHDDLTRLAQQHQQPLPTIRRTVLAALQQHLTPTPR